MTCSGRTACPSPRSRKGAGEVLTIIVQVDAPPGQAIGIKEAVAMRLEPLGSVRVISVMEDVPEQMHVAGYGGTQGPPGPRGG